MLQKLKVPLLVVCLWDVTYARDRYPVWTESVIRVLNEKLTDHAYTAWAPYFLEFYRLHGKDTRISPTCIFRPVLCRKNLQVLRKVSIFWLGVNVLTQKVFIFWNKPPKNATQKYIWYYEILYNRGYILSRYWTSQRSNSVESIANSLFQWEHPLSSVTQNAGTIMKKLFMRCDYCSRTTLRSKLAIISWGDSLSRNFESFRWIHLFTLSRDTISAGEIPWFIAVTPYKGDGG